MGGHLFSVTADAESLMLMGNYEPFAAAEKAGCPRKAFTLTVEPGDAPVPAEHLRQVDGEQTILWGNTADGHPLFEFQWCGATVGWMVCFNDYREGRLIPTGNFKKLAIDNALMVMYALSTASEKTVLFHAAAVSHADKGYIFLGPSGTGKSTHARLWLQYIKGVELINDDNPVVRIGNDGVARVYGTPWSGKTRCYRNVCHPLDSIVLLAQAPSNTIRRLGGIQAFAALLPSISGSRRDVRIADGLHRTEDTLAMTVPIWHMGCLPDEEAARMCASAIINRIQ